MPTAVDDSPSPSPSPSPFVLGFRTPAGPLSSPLPSPSPSPEESSDPEGLAPDSGDEWDAANPPSPEGTSSEGSSPGSDAEAVSVELFDADDLATLARGGVAFAGEKAHELLATTPGKQQVGLYRTDETDQAQIGDPLARIAARHQGVAGNVNPDTKDLLSALVGIAGYGLKQINRVGQARQLDAAAAAAPQPQEVPGA